MSDRRRVTHAAPPGLPGAEALVSRPHVVVVGGGIAGLAAATGLAERGISVDVLERERFLGGRVAGWTEQCNDGTPLAMNRGFHAFFRQYYNLRALLRRSDPHLAALTPVDDYPLIDAQGRRDTFRGLPQTPPWNAIAFTLRSPTFRLRDLGRLNARAAAPLAAVSVPNIYQRLDHLDAETFLKNINFPEAARHLAFEVFSRSFFVEPSQLSAAELASMFHIYFLGSSEGLVFDVPTSNFDTALWDPLANYLAGRGVRFRTGVSATTVCQGGVKAFRVDDDTGTSDDADGVVLATDVHRLRRIVDASPDLGDNAWRSQILGLRTAPPYVVQRLWLNGRSVTTGPRSWERPASNRSTMSASWIVTSGKPPIGPRDTAVRSWNCTPTPSRNRRPTTGLHSECWPGCTRCIPRPRGRRSWPSGCYAATTARSSVPAITPVDPASRRRTRRWPSPATVSGSTCR